MVLEHGDASECERVNRQRCCRTSKGDDHTREDVKVALLDSESDDRMDKKDERNLERSPKAIPTSSQERAGVRAIGQLLQVGESHWRLT